MNCPMGVEGPDDIGGNQDSDHTRFGGILLALTPRDSAARPFR